jgi:hypothetical protein
MYSGARPSIPQDERFLVKAVKLFLRTPLVLWSINPVTHVAEAILPAPKKKFP